MKRALIVIIIFSALLLSVSGLFAQTSNDATLKSEVNSNVRESKYSPAATASTLDDIINAKKNIVDPFTTSGTNTYTGTSQNPINSYQTGLQLIVNFATPNTGASTLNINDIGPADVEKDGAAVVAGELSGPKLLYYDGTAFQIVGDGDTGGVSTIVGITGTKAEFDDALTDDDFTYLATAQTNTGAKTFLDGTLLMRNVANTHSSRFTNTNTSSRTYTTPNFNGTLFLLNTQGLQSSSSVTTLDLVGEGALFNITGSDDNGSVDFAIGNLNFGFTADTYDATGDLGASIVNANGVLTIKSTADSYLSENTWGFSGGSSTYFDGKSSPDGIKYGGSGYESTDLTLTSRGWVLGAKTFTGSQTFRTSTTSAGTAPIYIPAGTLMTTPENTAIENNGTHLYYTTGGTRYQLDQQSTGGIDFAALRASRSITSADAMEQTDQFTLVYLTSASPFDLTLDEMLDGTQYFLRNDGTADVTIVDGAGVTSSGGSTIPAGQDAMVVYKTGTTPEVTVTGGTGVSKDGTPADNQIGVWTGDGTIEGTSSLTYSSNTLSAAGGFDFYGAHQRIRYNESANLLYSTKLSASAASSLTVSGSPGISASPNGQTLIIDSGSGYSSGNGNGGNIQFSLGSGTGTGVDGNVDIGGNPATFQSMEKGIYIRDVNTAPSGNPTGGVFVWVDNTDGKLKVLADDGETYEMVIPTSATTGAVISFTKSQIYNSVASPSSSNITDNLTGARLSIIQKIYHNNSSEPTYPAGWVNVGGSYTNSTLNIIYAEWVSGTRVEYWITQ